MFKRKKNKKKEDGGEQVETADNKKGNTALEEKGLQGDSFTLEPQFWSPWKFAIGIAGAKRHWSSYAQIKRQQTNRICWIARGQLKPITAPVDLVFEWITKHRRVDPDNISHGSKYAIDGLVNAGILPDDGRRTIRSRGC